MKSLAAFIILIAIIAFDASAQIRIGARVGLQLSTLTGDEDFREDKAMKPGISSGPVVDIGGKTAFSTGLLFNTQGVRWSADNEKYTFRMTCLQVPMEVKINLGNSDNTVSGFINVGPYLGLWLKGKEIYVYDSDKETEDYEFDSDYDRRVDVGAAVGGGVSFNFGNHIIQAGPRFAMGFLDVNKYPDGKPDDVKANLNAAIAVLNITYLFQVKD